LLKPCGPHANFLVFPLAVGDNKLRWVELILCEGREIEVIIDNELLSAVAFHRIVDKHRPKRGIRLDGMLTPARFAFIRTTMQDIDVLSSVASR